MLVLDQLRDLLDGGFERECVGEGFTVLYALPYGWSREQRGWLQSRRLRASIAASGSPWALSTSSSCFLNSVRCACFRLLASGRLVVFSERLKRAFRIACRWLCVSSSTTYQVLPMSLRLAFIGGHNTPMKYTLLYCRKGYHTSN